MCRLLSSRLPTEISLQFGICSICSSLLLKTLCKRLIIEIPCDFMIWSSLIHKTICYVLSGSTFFFWIESYSTGVDWIRMGHLHCDQWKAWNSRLQDTPYITKFFFFPPHDDPHVPISNQTAKNTKRAIMLLPALVSAGRLKCSETRLSIFNLTLTQQPGKSLLLHHLGDV